MLPLSTVPAQQPALPGVAPMIAQPPSSAAQRPVGGGPASASSHRAELQKSAEAQCCPSAPAAEELTQRSPTPQAEPKKKQQSTAWVHTALVDGALQTLQRPPTHLPEQHCEY